MGAPVAIAVDDEIDVAHTAMAGVGVVVFIGCHSSFLFTMCWPKWIDPKLFESCQNDCFRDEEVLEMSFGDVALVVVGNLVTVS
jgi:hypothetical protein